MTPTTTMSAPPAKIRIDIVSDVVCPWCIIGYKQLLTRAGQHGKQSELQMALLESPPTCCNL